MVSVIIPTLNEADYIGKLLQSLEGQPGVGEIIIVDGSSADGTAVKAGKIATDLNLHLRIENLQRADVATQRNQGANSAQYPWLLFLDADVILPPLFVEQGLKELATKQILMAGARFYAAEQHRWFRLGYWIFAWAAYPLLRLRHPVLHGCALFVDKNLHHQIGGFRSGITFEDYEYSIKAASLTKPVLLRSTYVRTSARRFYKNTPGELLELVKGTMISSLFAKHVNHQKMEKFHKKTGQHPSPKY